MAELTGAQLEHDAFLYGSDEQLVTAMVPFLQEGLTRGDAAAAVTTPGNLALLRDRLGADAHVSYVEAADWYVRPAAAIAQFDAAIRELIDGGAPHLRVVGELPFGSTAGEHASWNRYEAIVNEAFKRAPLWVVCLYDTRALPEQLIEAARRTHPTLFEARRRRQSADYVEPAVLLGQIPEPSVPVAGPPRLQLRIDGDPRGWRRSLAGAVEAEDLPRGRAEEFLIAVGEVVANALGARSRPGRAHPVVHERRGRLCGARRRTGRGRPVRRIPPTRERRCRPGHGPVGRQAAQRLAGHPVRSRRNHRAARDRPLKPV